MNFGFLYTPDKNTGNLWYKGWQKDMPRKYRCGLMGLFTVPGKQNRDHGPHGGHTHTVIHAHTHSHTDIHSVFAVFSVHNLNRSSINTEYFDKNFFFL